ncbi:DNA-binding transcriptional repressor DeoR [Avibacterium sp. 21-599]|uniref:DNA-binding transcriptional repressor DeoR n=1 Tax=Avibacterium sp. 21-599 TaxID=2911528 RepID=UPI0022464BE5|nr:DNA-binding transcriptional repressor DeoR [Avibacterium sp. 21-599]MCW9717197.1 DNA-binding transcriptional repressor DeoR [Avibacterium sp. 21-599]
MYDKKVKNRIQQLESFLQQVERLHLRDASEILNVSEMTIRRDISNQTSILLLGGYLFKAGTNKNNYFISDQKDKNLAEKMQIGKIAASLVNDGDVVFFDCGTTMPFIASQISNKIHFTAICCSINTFMVLQEKRHCEIILCGGIYSRDNALLTSIQTQSILDDVCTTKAFIATSGIDLYKGLTCFRFSEAQIKKKAMLKTKQKILLFDHSKINSVYPAYIGELNDFDIVICDQQIPTDFKLDRDNFLTV